MKGIVECLNCHELGIACNRQGILEVTHERVDPTKEAVSGCELWLDQVVVAELHLV